jgi:MBG domain (YGX type)/NHL repeat
MRFWRFLPVVAAILAGFANVPLRAGAQTFQHPGVLVSQAQLDYIKAQVNAKVNPFYQEFLNAQASPYGSLTYTPQGPYTGGVNQCGSNSTPNNGCSAADSDSAAAYVQALLWYISGNQAYANNAIAIMNAYGHNLKGYAGFTSGIPCPGGSTTCSNGPLQAAWDSTKWPRAAEIIRYGHGGTAGWAASDVQAFSSMLTNVYEPLIYNGSGENGNWELSMIEGMMGIAVFNEDSALLAHAQLFWSQRIPAYFYYYPIDGNAPAPFPRNSGSTNWNGQAIFNASVSGIAQETCRDMKHTHYGISSAIAAAETDHIQGGTLFASQQARLITALEFNAGIDVQGLANKGTTLTFPPSADMCTADNNSTNDNTVTLGEGYTFVVGYNEYHNRLGQAMPNTQTWIAQGVLPTIIPYDVGAHMTVFEPLTHYLDASAAAPNFSLGATPASQTVMQGSNNTYMVTATPVFGYTNNVTLSVTSGLPAGATAGFSPATLTGGTGSSTLTVSANSSAATGSYSLVISGTDGTLTNTTTATLVVGSANGITITASNQAVTSGGTMPALTYSVSPTTMLDTTPTCVSSANASSNPGVYPGAITCSGAAKAGYSISYVAGQMTVTASNVITVTATNQTMTYGGTLPTLGYGSGYASTGGLSTKATCVTTATSSSPPGVYPITCSGAVRSGDTIVYVPGQLTINPIAATITANNQNMVAGSTVPSLSYGSSVSGLSYTTAPVCSTTATTASPVGMYPISCGSAMSLGYSFSYVGGTLIVTAGPQNIWVLNGNATLSEMNNSGGGVSPSGYGSGNSGIAIDASGDVWTANSAGNSVLELNGSGALMGSYTGGGLSAPVTLAVSGGGDVWIANGNNSVSLLSHAGAAKSPATGFTGGGLSAPTSIAIDNAGNIWVANSGNNSLTQFLGATDPVVTPTATAAGAGTLGVQP